MQKTVKAPGLKAIADEVNVSVSLVSKVLNDRLGNSRVVPETVEAIHAAAKALGYRKNHAAAALVAGRQNVIGAYVHQLGVPTSGVSEKLVRGMAAGAARHGKRLMLRFVGSATEFLDHSSEISPTLLDGVIVAGIRHAELAQHLAEIEASGVPVVTVHESYEKQADLGFPNVYVDQMEVCELATRHLIELGCRRIAHLRVMDSRYGGYQRALRDCGLQMDSRLVYRIQEADPFRWETGVEAVKRLLADGVEFDGIVAQSDEQAYGATLELQKAGIRVPEDVKVVGVDDSDFCRILPTPISSVSTEFYVQGQCAVDLLAHRIEGRTVSSMRIDPMLHPRASSQVQEAHLSRSGVGKVVSETISVKGAAHVQ